VIASVSRTLWSVMRMRDAPVAQAPDDLLDVADGDGVDAAGERLVEQQILGEVTKGAG